jgi:hypothetical protein
MRGFSFVRVVVHVQSKDTCHWSAALNCATSAATILNHQSLTFNLQLSPFNHHPSTFTLQSLIFQSFNLQHSIFRTIPLIYRLLTYHLIQASSYNSQASNLKLQTSNLKVQPHISNGRPQSSSINPQTLTPNFLIILSRRPTI